MVIFYSESILHRVKPAFNKRYCLTIWLDSEMDIAQSQVALPWPGMQDFLDLDPLFKTLANPDLQRLLSRAVYEEEYEKSMRDSLGASSDFQLLLKAHKARIDELNQKMGPIIAHLRSIKIALE
jgi:hypothetical protein